MKHERDNKKNGCLIALIVTFVTVLLLFILLVVFLYKSIMNVPL